MNKFYRIFFTVTVLSIIFVSSVSATVRITSPYDFGLMDYYPPVKGVDMKSIFLQVKSELPEEIPVMVPREIKGETVFYVSNDGKNTNSGTIDKPFNTIAHALYATKSLPYEIRRRGVVIYLREGVYKFAESLLIDGSMSGTRDAPLFISSYNNEKVVITSSDVLKAEDFTNVTDTKKLSALSEEASSQLNIIGLSSFIERTL